MNITSTLGFFKRCYNKNISFYISTKNNKEKGYASHRYEQAKY